MAAWMDQAIDAFTQVMPAGTFWSLTFNVRGLMALVLASLICCAVGSLIVGNRMSFFSDALAHVAFAGAALGWLLLFSFGLPLGGDTFDQSILGVMIGLGILVGLGIQYVR